MSKFFGFGDGHYDPPDEPETTLEQDLIIAVDKFLAMYAKYGASTCREAGSGDLMKEISIIRSEMKQADDAENTAQYEAETALDKEMQEAFETNQARLHDDDGDWQERHDGPTSGEEF